MQVRVLGGVDIVDGGDAPVSVGGPAQRRLLALLAANRTSITVADLIASLELVPEQVAVERNGVLVPRATHAATKLVDGDSLELVTLVGGG